MMDIKTETYDVLFAILRYALWGRQNEEPGEQADYSLVYKELTAHGIECMVAEVWNEFSLLNQQELICAVAQNIGNWHKLMLLQNDLVEILQEAQIPFVILKGAAVNCYYPIPEYRRMGDIDVIVNPNEFRHADHVLQERGYKVIGESERHKEFVKQGKLVELHKRFVVIEDEEKKKKLDNRIFEKIEFAEMKSIGDYTFPVLPKLENGLTLLYHICQHLEIGLGLRQILDWMYYVDSELNDEFWDSCFQLEAKELGMEKLAVVVTRMCQKYLGLRQSIKWCEQADDALCDELMALIMESGNFGRKLTKVEHKLSRTGSLKSFFALLQEYGVRNWKAIEKYSFLKGFAWLYQLTKYINIYFENKLSFMKVINDMRRSRKKSKLLSSLGVTRRFNKA